MIRSAHSRKPVLEDKAEKAMTWWGQTPECSAIAVELEDGRMFVFPKSDLLFAEYSGAAPVEKLRLSFSSHEVMLMGHALRALTVGIQTGAVVWVKSFSEAFGAFLTVGSGHITSIEIQRNAGETDSKGDSL